MQKTAGPKKFSFYPISRIDGVKTCKNWFLSKSLEVEASVWSLFFFVSMFLCFFVPGSLCFDVSLFLCFCSYVSLYLDFIVSMFLCLCASLFLCLFASLFLCFLVSLFLCLNFAKVHINLCLFCMKLGHYKGLKLTEPDFQKKIRFINYSWKCVQNDGFSSF